MGNLTSLDRKVIKVYLIIYDGEPGRAYSFTDPRKAYSSIITSVREYLDDESQEAHALYKEFSKKLSNLWGEPHVPIQFNNLYINVYTLELDKWNPLHQVLIECYNTVKDKELKGKIAKLFSDGSL